MGHWAYHYLWIDVYNPVWPNIAASAILGVWAFRKFLHLEKLHRANHEQHMEKLEDIHNAVRNQSSGRQLPGN
jgi:hypothetical protein